LSAVKRRIEEWKAKLIDGATLITEAFNFTKATEEKNAENLLVINGDTELVKRYLANFNAHLDYSEKYEGREEWVRLTGTQPNTA
jgi:phosphatidylserine/phosphatidylglycerophosphate/cardiolipin synthase-like enzyme